MNKNSILIDVTALVFMLYGLGFIFLPLELAALVTGEAPATGTAIADMRATYGGMSVAIGMLLFALARKTELQRFGLFAVTTVMLGMAGGRTVGLVVDSPVNSIMYYFLALEVVVAIAALILLIRSREL